MNVLLRVAALLSTGLCALVVGACGGDSSDDAKAAGGESRTHVAVAAAAPSPTHVGFWLAKVNGYFEDEGLDVEVISTQGAAAVVQAFQAGKIQLGLLSPSTAMQTFKRGKALQVIAGLSDAAFDQPLVSTEFLRERGIDPAAFAGLPLDQRLAALRGSRWTVSGSGNLLDTKIRLIAKNANLNPDRDFKIQVVGETSVADSELLKQGKSDAAFFDLPEAADFKERGVAVPLLNEGDLPVIQKALLTQVVIDAEWAEEHQQAARGIAAAVARANREFDTEDVKTVATALHKEFSELPVDEIVRQLEAIRPIVPADSRIPKAIIESNIELALAQGAIKERPTADDVYTERYLP